MACANPGKYLLSRQEMPSSPFVTEPREKVINYMDNFNKEHSSYFILSKDGWIIFLTFNQSLRNQFTKLNILLANNLISNVTMSYLTNELLCSYLNNQGLPCFPS